MTTKLHRMSAIDIAGHIRRREITAIECLDYFRKRVERFDAAINSIIVRDWDRAYEQARIADRRLSDGETVGPLHGVPMTVKESLDVAGLPTTWGDPALRTFVPEEDDLIVERLKLAGAVIFGKTNVPLRLLDFQSYNEIYGMTNNPWDTSRGPGGSSGGAAAALAAGLTSLEIGTDIGGSIRNPAHYCGVFGHKPTYGLVGTERSSIPPLLRRQDITVAGPMARSAEDLAATLKIIAGPDRYGRGVWRVDLPRPVKPLKDYRIAVWARDEIAPVSREISERCHLTARRLVALGATVSDTARPAFTPEHASSVYRKLLNAATDPTNPIAHMEWRTLDNERAKLRALWHDFFEQWDIVLCPISATTAIHHDHSAMRGRKVTIDGVSAPYFQQLFWAGLAACSYLPATVFPAGSGADGLPVGLQAIGDAYQDLKTIEFARLASTGFVSPPGYDE